MPFPRLAGLVLLLTIGCFQSGDVRAQAVAPNPDVNRTTSYHQQSRVGPYIDLPFSPTITLKRDAGYLAWACADFDRDGDVDIVAVNVDWTPEGEPVSYFRNGGGGFVSDPSVFGAKPPVVVHGRKAIVGDFDANGWPDVVIAGHGFDKPPFQGEPLRMLLNDRGRFTARELPVPNGFYHSVCAGDVDNDGDVDLFVTDALNGKKICKFLVNDGKGVFAYDARRFPEELRSQYFFTSELYDVDRDGFLDLVVGGHEMDGTPTRVLWGGASGRYTRENSTVLPALRGFWVVIDIDFVERTAGGTDILLNRTGDNRNPVGWYNGHCLQLLRATTDRLYEDVSLANLRSHYAVTGPWITWLRVHDVNGDGAPDITAADRANGQEWVNARGVFERRGR